MAFFGDVRKSFSCGGVRLGGDDAQISVVSQ